MDRDALERSLARRLIEHIENRTTDMADAVLEVPAEVYLGARHEREVDVLFRGWPCPARCRRRRPTGPSTSPGPRCCSRGTRRAGSGRS
jgi:hypothetical protein